MAAESRRRMRTDRPPVLSVPGAPSPVWPRVLIVLAVILALGAVAFFPVALATDRSVFCKSCHTMEPFYDAWTTGAHAQHAQCIDCHVDPGYPSRFMHKFVALREVWAQLLTHATFPSYNADVTEARCLRCHPDAQTKVVGNFRHAEHTSRGIGCAKCHATTGHKVTFEALAAAGLLNKANAPSGATFVGQEFSDIIGSGSAYPGHRPVPCQNCHDQAKLQCSFCHTPPANHYGTDCRSCHSNAAVPFAQFNHPPSGEHSWRSRPCVKCHPNGYTTVYCTCHKGRPPRD